MKYLLSLTLPARQLAQLSLLFSCLTKTNALHQTLQRLIQLLWMEDVVSILPIVLQHLFSGAPSRYASQLETLKEMLHSPTCGAFSELQVNLVAVHCPSAGVPAKHWLSKQSCVPASCKQ